MCRLSHDFYLTISVNLIVVYLKCSNLINYFNGIYLTIRQRGRVVFEQEDNEAQEIWL